MALESAQQPDSSDPSTWTAFPEAWHIFLKDGRIEAYPMAYVKSLKTTRGYLVITTNIGLTFVYPSSMVHHVKETAPTDFPAFTSFKFNNKFNDQLFTDVQGEIVGDTIFLKVAAIGKRLTPSFKLPDEGTLVYVNGEQQNSKASRLRFDKDIYYVVTRPGVKMLMPKDGSYKMQPYGRLVRVHVDWLTDRADVPRIYINTDDGQPVTSKDYYKDAEIIIDGCGIFPSTESTPVRIKGRGNTSWLLTDKKPYRLKFDESVKPLGMTKGKSWVLLGNYLTGSLLNNAIGMKAANLIGTVAANHIVPVDLYLNGDYRGSYNLTEKVGLANNSVDLEDESAAALLEFDTYYDEPVGQKFHSTPYRLPVNIKEPDFSEGTTSLTFDIIKNSFNDFLSHLSSGQDIAPYVDIEQLARFLMVNELTCNFELYHPKSLYCYRESFESDTSKYVFGPVWDLDWAFGYENHYRYFQDNATSNYWMEAPQFGGRQFTLDLRWEYGPLSPLYEELWRTFMEDDLQELIEYCRDYYDFARHSLESDSRKWGNETDYAAMAERAASWIEARAHKIYEDILSGVKPDDIIQYNALDAIERVDIAADKVAPVYDLSGRLIDNGHEGRERSAYQHLPKGIYIMGGRKVVVR